MCCRAVEERDEDKSRKSEHGLVGFDRVLRGKSYARLAFIQEEETPRSMHYHQEAS